MVEPDPNEEDFKFELAPSDAPARHREMVSIEKEYPCAICGYDLRGLPKDSNCPECGMGIENAMINGEALATWRHRLASTIQQELAILFVLLVIGNLAMLLRTASEVWITLPIWIVVLLLSLMDLAAITEPMPGEAGLRKRFPHIRYRFVIATMNVWMPLFIAITLGMLWLTDQISVNLLIWSASVATAVRIAFMGFYLEETFRSLRYKRTSTLVTIAYLVAALMQLPLMLTPVLRPGMPSFSEVVAYFVVTGIVTFLFLAVIASTTDVLTNDDDAQADWIQAVIRKFYELNIFREPETMLTDEAIKNAAQTSSIQAAVQSRLRSRQLTEDVYCIECGYNLRTLMTNGNCPECARPVYETLSSNAPSVRDWRTAMSSAAREEGMPAVITLAAMLPALVFPVWFALLGGIAVWLCGAAVALFTIEKSLTPHPGDRDAREWLMQHTYALHTLPAISIYALSCLLLMFVSNDLSHGQRIGIGAAAILGARFIVVGWWHAHLIRLIDPLLLQLSIKLRISTILLAISQVVFMAFITQPGRIWSCAAAVLIVMLAAWSVYIYGEAGEALEPPLRDLRNDYA